MLLKLIFKEILHRRLNFLLALLAVTLAVAFFVSFFTANEASNRETRRLTRDMGFNLRIIPKETDMNRFWINGYSDQLMPEDYVDLFWGFRDFSFAHLTATLHMKTIWQNREVILTGIAPSIEPSGKEKASMIFHIDPGSVYVGYELANNLQIKQGDMIEILNRPFRVARTLAETGSVDDIRIQGSLADFQDMLSLNGKINEIMAINCLCISPDDRDPLVILREQISQVLPEATLIMDTTIATVREQQRQMLERYFSLITGFLILVIAVWIGTLTMFNVKERQQEIGILLAIGHSSAKIAGLFFGKMVVTGIISAVVGYLTGTMLALYFGPAIFKITADSIEPIGQLLFYSVIGAPVFSVIAAFLPILSALLKDPAMVLRNR